jgi:hypothetical protein
MLLRRKLRGGGGAAMRCGKYPPRHVYEVFDERPDFGSSCCCSNVFYVVYICLSSLHRLHVRLSLKIELDLYCFVESHSRHIEVNGVIHFQRHYIHII